MFKNISLLFLLLFAAAATLSAADIPLFGTWKTNPAKTKVLIGPGPTMNVNKYEPSGPNGIKYTSERTDASGQKFHYEFTANFDGRNYPYTGPGTDRDGITIKRIDSNTFEVVYKKGTETLQINYWIVSKDGKTLTTVSTGIGSNNQVYSRLVVADKQ